MILSGETTAMKQLPHNFMASSCVHLDSTSAFRTLLSGMVSERVSSVEILSSIDQEDYMDIGEHRSYFLSTNLTPVPRKSEHWRRSRAPVESWTLAGQTGFPRTSENDDESHEFGKIHEYLRSNETKRKVNLDISRYYRLLRIYTQTLPGDLSKNEAVSASQWTGLHCILRRYVASAMGVEGMKTEERERKRERKLCQAGIRRGYSQSPRTRRRSITRESSKVLKNEYSKWSRYDEKLGYKELSTYNFV
ncbi:hypothetical protein V1478_003452 [Vespula squamosa]|uniref:Uncharacterized protein n=1 Tax=Vespula squamosa TaxID=30214 RepID=A0ABD2BME0_VESSQ